MHNLVPFRALAGLVAALACGVSARAQTCPLEDPAINTAKSHWLFLYFPTASDSSFPAYDTNVSPVAPFNVSALSPGIGTTAQLIATIGNVVIDDYCEFDVQVHTTTTNPASMSSPPARRVTVGIGDDSNNGTWGEAQEVDTGDAIDIDFARVWAGTYLTCEGGAGPPSGGPCTSGALTGTNATLDHWAQAIGGTAAHEAGHTYGLAHSDDDPPNDTSEPGPAPLAGEDPYYQHLMPAGLNLTASQRADYRRHFSDRTFGILATNVGLSIETMHNWNLVNPNAESASSLAIAFLSTLSTVPVSWTYTGTQSPWLNPTVSGPSGTAVFKGVTYNKYTITWSSPNPAWTDSAPGVVAGGAVFHIGATFTGVDFNSPSPIIIQDVTLFDARSNPLVLHPRLAGYDAGTLDSSSGDLSINFFPPPGLQLQSARIYQLPRVAAIESMVGKGEPVTFDKTPIRPWSVSDCPAASLQKNGVACTIANLADKPHVQFAYRLGDPGVVDCTRRRATTTNQPRATIQDRSTALDYEGPICAGTAYDPFPSATVYVIASFVDPAAKHYDPVTKTYVVGPVVTTVYYQFAGTRKRPAGGPIVAERQGRLFAGVLTGASWPVGSMTKSFNPGFHFEGFLEARVTPPAVAPDVRLGLEIGFHEFDPKNPSAISAANLNVTNFSPIVRILGGGSYRPFILAGFGAYHAYGVTKPGAQLGAGLDVPISRLVSFVPGLTFHVVAAPQPPLGRLEWFDAFLGFTLRLP
jgi:hypothetical protein